MKGSSSFIFTIYASIFTVHTDFLAVGLYHTEPARIKEIVYFANYYPAWALNLVYLMYNERTYIAHFYTLSLKTEL